jgi:DNA-directed RNA polymerase specialized sigma24 family protein
VFEELSTKAIIEGCQAEAAQPRAEESGYCFELFRRALEEEEPAAWLAIDQQYRQLILHWGQDCAPDLPRQEVEQVVTATLPKFWQSLTRSAEPLTGRFVHVGAILKYLKQCTVSVLLDYRRQLKRRERLRQRLESEAVPVAGQDSTEEALTERLAQEQLLQRVRAWIQGNVTDSQERLVLSLSYQAGLSPCEIADRYPQEFPDAQSVRRIKERVLKRARRALREEQGVARGQSHRADRAKP